MKKDDCIACCGAAVWRRTVGASLLGPHRLVRFERNEQNNCRRPYVRTMLDISNVLLFRRLSIPCAISIAAGYGRQPSRRPCS